MTQLPEQIRERSAGIKNGWEVTGKCHWEKIEGWSCLVDDAGLIHQIHGDYCPLDNLKTHESSADWY